MNLDSIFAALDLQPDCHQGGDRAVFTPIDGSEIAHVTSDDAASVARKIVAAEAAFVAWRAVPAPSRGELIRLLGEELRAHKEALGRLVTLESGKILQEGMGEVQEMIDICDFAGGLSRQLYGLTIASERPGHRMMETWHPLGVCAVISAFSSHRNWDMTTDLKFSIQTNDIKHAHSNAIPDTETRSTVVRDAGIFGYVDKTLSPDQINDFFKACDKYGMLARAVGSRHLEASKASLLTPTEIFARSN